MSDQAVNQGLLAAVTAILSQFPETGISLGRWIVDHADGGPPAPGEYPKMVHGRTCANRADEKRSLALGPVVEAPRPPSDFEKAVKAFELKEGHYPSDYEKAAINFELAQLERRRAQGARDAGAAAFVSGNVVSAEELAELVRAGHVVRNVG